MKTSTRTPSKVNVSELQDQLRYYEKSWHANCVTDDFYLGISESIRKLIEQAPSEPYLLRDWVWINARFRIAHPSTKDTARITWSALNLLTSMMTQLENGDKDVISDIVWLTDRTVEIVLDQLGPQSINRFISPEEQSKIDDLIMKLGESDEEGFEDLEAVAKDTAAMFTTIHHAAYFPSIASKLLGLCHVARESTEAGYWAKAALRYVYTDQDVIDDRQGYVGYLDDIHVIENMYAIVFGEIPWKQLIDHATQTWPFLSRIHCLDDDTTNHLSPLFKAVISCCLDSLLEHKHSRIVVLPEIGPCGFLAATASVMAATEHDKSRPVLEPGTFASFRDGHISRYVEIMPPFILPDGSQFSKIKLRDCERSISSDDLMLLDPVHDTDVSLATSNQFIRWLSAIQADSQTAIRRFHGADSKTSVIYVTNSSNYFSFIETIRPYGRRLDELVSIEYRSRSIPTPHRPGASLTNPSMIVCSNLDVAERILREEKPDIIKPRMMIVDRTVDHVALMGLIERMSKLSPETKTVVFAQINSGTRFLLQNWQNPVWLVQPEDIEPSTKADDPILVSEKGNGPLSHYEYRQKKAQNVKYNTHIVEYAELEDFYEVASKILQRTRVEQDTSLVSFAMNAYAALNYVSMYPPVGTSIEDDRLISVLTNLSQHAKVAGIYDQDVDNLATVSNDLVESLKNKNPKALVLSEIVENYPDCRVVVASRVIAESLSKVTLNLGHNKVKFTSIHELESLYNTESLIVPGWLGRNEMLRLQLSGWSDVQIRLFFDFEYQRHKSLSGNLERTYDFLSKRTKESWTGFSTENPDVGSPPAQVKSKSRQEPDVKLSELEDDSADKGDWVESAIRHQIGSDSTKHSNSAEINGRLVFFSDGQHYGVFAENANLVCLNEVIGEGQGLSQLSELEAEQLLWKGTNQLEIGDVLAFPNDHTLGDVIDGLADAIIGDEGTTRYKSGRWRDAVKELYTKNNWNLSDTKNELYRCGVERSISTLTSWLFGSRTVAPRNPSVTIPKILECAGYDESSTLAREILKNVNAIYTARKKAGHVLVSQLSTATLSVLGDGAVVEINGKEVHYKVLSISSIDDTAKYHASYLGVHSISEGLPEVKR